MYKSEVLWQLIKKHSNSQSEFGSNWQILVDFFLIWFALIIRFSSSQSIHYEYNLRICWLICRLQCCFASRCAGRWHHFPPPSCGCRSISCRTRIHCSVCCSICWFEFWCCCCRSSICRSRCCSSHCPIQCSSYRFRCWACWLWSIQSKEFNSNSNQSHFAMRKDFENTECSFFQIGEIWKVLPIPNWRSLPPQSLFRFKN